MIKYVWNNYNGYVEVNGIEENSLTKTLVSEARIVLKKDDSMALVSWIYVPKNQQGNGYAEELLREIKSKIISLYENELNVIKFKDVTSTGVISLIKKVFPNAELDFSHLPKNIADIRKSSFENNPWIPSISPAKYSGKEGCTIKKNSPSVNLISRMS